MKKSYSKIIAIVLALMIIVGAFVYPTYVFADDYDEIVYSVVYSGQYSFSYEDEVPTPTPAPLTPDGQGTILDRATNSDYIEVITITTRTGNVFFLIIDHQRESNNVFFLNSVTEHDLITMAEAAGIPAPPPVVLPEVTLEYSSQAGSASNTTQATPAYPETTSPAQEQVRVGGSSGNTGVIVFMLFVVLVVGSVAYYVKILKPKKQRASDSDASESDSEYSDEYIDEDDDDIRM